MALDELIAVVAKLRDPESGCPWDLKQTHASLAPYALEEAHELADAIEHGDNNALMDELGDLLLQVVLHAQIAKERGAFDLGQVIETISAKMKRRHPHVFNPEGPARSWEEIKAKVEEELDELKDAVASGNRAHAQEELGDVFFTLINLARWCELDPTAGLSGTNHRFLDRFSRVEAALAGELEGCSITELEKLWQQAKAQIKAER